METGTIAELGSGDLDRQVLGSALPVLVDFWAPWCGPCMAVAPILEDLARELQGKMRFVKVDIDQHPDLAARFQVSTLPTFLLFKQGAAADRLLGAQPKLAFRQFLSRHL